MSGFEIEVRHSFDAGHRVYGHEGGAGKCARLHGHTYGVVVTITGEQLNSTGFVVDFGVVKDIINEWDHRTLLWDQDPLTVLDYVTTESQLEPDHDGVVRVPFNPTAENMARYLAERFIAIEGVEYAAVVLSETPKTTARYASRYRA